MSEIGYLRNLKTQKLLTHKQVCELVEDVKKHWLPYSQVSDSELNDEQKKLKAQGLRARNKIVHRNMQLVAKIAMKYQSKTSLGFEDLVQEGADGLCRAVEKFEPSKGYQFSTYAYYWIKQSITRAIANKSNTIRLPIPFQEQQRKIKRFVRSRKQQGKAAAIADIATEFGRSPEWVALHLKKHNPLSLQFKPKGLDGNGDELQDMLPSGEDVEANAIQQEKREQLEFLMSLIAPREREIIKLHEGWEEEPLSFSKIGNRLGLTKQNANRIYNDGIRRLRKLAVKSALFSPLEGGSKTFDKQSYSQGALDAAQLEIQWAESKSPVEVV